MPVTDKFQAELDAIFNFAGEKRLAAIIVTAGDLHHLVGGYPGEDHRMPVCCNVMRHNMLGGDEILAAPPSGAGASLTIKYQFPRKAEIQP